MRENPVCYLVIGPIQYVMEKSILERALLWFDTRHSPGNSEWGT